MKSSEGKALCELARTVAKECNKKCVGAVQRLREENKEGGVNAKKELEDLERHLRKLKNEVRNKWEEVEAGGGRWCGIVLRFVALRFVTDQVADGDRHSIYSRKFKLIQNHHNFTDTHTHTHTHTHKTKII